MIQTVTDQYGVTKERVKEVMEEVEALDLPEGAYWMLIHERLNLEYGAVFEFIAAEPTFFGYRRTIVDEAGNEVSYD